MKPPLNRKQLGKPKKHIRRKEPKEMVKRNKISKEGTKVRCGYCRELVHDSNKNAKSLLAIIISFIEKKKSI
jgi:hypothetical protein